MKIVSYSKTTDKATGSSGGSGGGSGSSSEIQNPVGTRGELDRSIWGQTDIGDDIDGHMTVCGDVRIKVIEERSYDADDDGGDGDDIEYDEGGGNLIVDLNTSTKTLDVTEDAYVKRHLYIDYLKDRHEHPESGKMCVADILRSIEKNLDDEVSRAKTAEKANADAITAETNRAKQAEKANSDAIATEKDRATGVENNLADEIEKLKNRTSQTETENSDMSDEIDKLKTRIGNNETNISNNTSEIEALKADGSIAEQIKILKYGNYSNPVILYSGVLRKLSTSDIYTNNGSYKDCMLFTIKEINEGVMTIELSKSSLADQNINIYVTSISAIQQMSNDTEGRDNYYKERSNGAHWFEGWVGDTVTNKTTIYLREFHQGNGDNDTWYSSSWTESGGIRAVNLTISGYISFVS